MNISMVPRDMMSLVTNISICLLPLHVDHIYPDNWDTIDKLCLCVKGNVEMSARPVRQVTIFCLPSKNIPTLWKQFVSSKLLPHEYVDYCNSFIAYNIRCCIFFFIVWRRYYLFISNLSNKYAWKIKKNHQHISIGICFKPCSEIIQIVPCLLYALQWSKQWTEVNSLPWVKCCI